MNSYNVKIEYAEYEEVISIMASDENSAIQRAWTVFFNRFGSPLPMAYKHAEII